MEQERYQQQYKAFVQQAEQRLNELCDVYLPVKAQISQAARYSLLGGGKRVRAVLVLAACQLAGGDTAAAADYAAALEMLHCYSLIHDDMPCMDNDDLRRGKSSCHVQFGEGIALLAGDALLTHAFSVVSSAYFSGSLPAETVLRCVNQLACAAGVEGMIGGQVIDTMPEEVPMTPEELEAMHGMKTGALIRASAVLGCLAACAPRDVILQADLYAAKIGLAFQIVDDILDVTETSEELGKSASDAENHKTTYITLYGVEKAREMVRRLVLEADLAVKGTMLDDEMLYELADTLAKRNH